MRSDLIAKLSPALIILSLKPGSSNGIEFLNADDEYALVKLYVGKISQLCSHFRFDEEVEATAMTYLKRFYLKNTVMDWHPKNVM
jgi:cyclin H